MTPVVSVGSKPERVADREDGLADDERARRAERAAAPQRRVAAVAAAAAAAAAEEAAERGARRPRPRRLDLEHREVLLGARRRRAAPGAPSTSGRKTLALSASLTTRSFEGWKGQRENVPRG